MKRLSLSLLLMVVIAVVAAGWAIDRLFDQFDTREDDTLQLAAVLGAQLALALDQTPTSRQGLAADDALLPDSLTILEREAVPLPEPLQQLLDDGQGLTLESERGVTLYFDMPKSGQLLSLAIEDRQQTAPLVRLLLTLLFYGVVIVLILIWLYPLIQRLQRLATTAKAFGKGDLSRRVPTHARSNLHDIEVEFNHMAQRIEGLLSDNKLLSSAVSHDLRTPLARLRFGIDALSETDDTELRARYIERLSADVTQMEQLVEVLLEFARLDSQLQELPLTATHLDALIQRCIENIEDTTATDITWSAGVGGHSVLANERYASMLIANVLQNAVTYGRGRVAVSVERRDERVRLLIDDDGGGIAEEERQEVLKPFTRGTRTSGRKATDRGGYGLGLAIVNRIAQWHDAELDIGRSPDLGGTRIGIAFRPA